MLLSLDLERLKPVLECSQSLFYEGRTTVALDNGSNKFWEVKQRSQLNRSCIFFMSQFLSIFLQNQTNNNLIYRVEQMSGWPNVRSDKCWVGQMLDWTNVGLDKCQVGQMLGQTNVGLDKCWVGQMLGWTNVGLDKCWVGQMLGWTNVGLVKCRFGQILGWTNVGLEKCWAGEVLGWTNVGLNKCRVEQMSLNCFN